MSLPIPLRDDEFITRTQLCRQLNIHLATARRLERSGRLTGYHITGKCARYRAADVRQFLIEASRRNKPGPKPRSTKAEPTGQPNNIS